MKKLLVLIGMLAAMVSAALPAAAQVGVSVRYGPPPPRYEVVPGPRPGYAWQGGEWIWVGNRYAWHPGHFVRHEGGRWVPAHWRRTPDGWVRVEGHWR